MIAFFGKLQQICLTGAVTCFIFYPLVVLFRQSPAQNPGISKFCASHFTEVFDHVK